MPIETTTSPAGFRTIYLHTHVYTIYNAIYIEINIYTSIYLDRLAPAVSNVRCVPQMLIKS